MRWNNLRINDPAAGDPTSDGDVRAAPPLPLALAGGVRRTFDTPGFAGITFHEVQAKSIISRVPTSSQMPFQFTINPYRGCSHACVYCLAGDTGVLMADGRTKALADVRVGDYVCGTVMRGSHRRYEPTLVLDHWSTVKHAYRVTLRDGTTLVASGEHRFLTEGGWRHVTAGSHNNTGERPFLAVGSKLLGVGDVASPVKETDGYRRGYLCALMRGDVNSGTPHRLRSALVDVESLDRTRRYLQMFDVETTGFHYEHHSARSQPMLAFEAAGASAIGDLWAWPGSADWPDPDWEVGLLAGIYDAGGSYSRGILRLTHLDTQVIERIVAALDRHGFRTSFDHAHNDNGLLAVRIAGGLREHLRFFHLVDPAITRKRSIAGQDVTSRADLAVASIEDLGLEMPMFDITTGTGDFIANGVVSHNCFARKTHEYLDLDAGRDFDSQIVVKVNAGELLRRELAAPRWRGAAIAMGTNVDCYQRAEGRYRLMPQIITALRDFANPFSILTKGTLILRDLDLLRQAAEVTSVGLSMSIGFVDEKIWRAVEPGTPSPRRRLDAVRALTDAGFAVNVLMAPILPALTDTEESIEATVRAIAAAGAASVVPLPLHLRPGAREWYQAWLRANYPALVAHYERLYGSRAYLPETEQRAIAARVRIAARRHHIGPGDRVQARMAPRDTGTPTPDPDFEQLTLL